VSMILLAGPVDSGAVTYLIFMIPAAFVGIAQGMTISPNQTLTLRAVDPAFGGVAGSIISLGQRMGTAVGTAIVPGVMFGIVAAQEDWLLAYRPALGIIADLASVALAVSVVDRRGERRCGGPPPPAPLRSGHSRAASSTPCLMARLASSSAATS